MQSPEDNTNVFLQDFFFMGRDILRLQMLLYTAIITSFFQLNNFTKTPGSFAIFHL
jgi:hypothetical protein